MRKLIIPLLMASAVMPVAAHAQDADRFADRRAERAERREQRAEQREDRARPERSQPSSPAVARSSGNDRPRAERPAPSFEGRREFEQRRIERQQRRAAPAGTVQAEPARPVTTAPVASQTDRSRGGFDQLRDRIVRDGKRVEDRRHDWHRDWRKDHRYDWRRHRDSHRWVFRIGTYYDPYRYGYRRFNIGYNLWPSYYSSRYWLNDPWMYRLPPVYGPYRWVRYYDDALLVNIYTGEVVDVIYSFFW